MHRAWQEAESGLNVADDIFREVDEEMRAERLRALARRYMILAGVIVAVICIGGGAWQYNAWRVQQADQASADAYFAALRNATASHAPDGQATPLNDQQKTALTQLAALEKTARPPLRALSRMERAALLANSGDTAQALALWAQVNEDRAADPTISSLAGLLWVQHQLDTADPAMLRSRLALLDGAQQPWHGLALECEALLDLRQGHEQDARGRLQRLSMDMNVSDGVRTRADGLLQALGNDNAGG